jgi:hypothetical protein
MILILNQFVALVKKGFSEYCYIPKSQSGPRFAHSFPSALHCDYRPESEGLQNYGSANADDIEAGKPRYRKYKRIELFGEDYDCSSDSVAVEI